MDEETQDENPSVSISSRHRSPGFSNDEVQNLVNIIEKYKYTILNKSSTSASNYAKELCWVKIAKIFNSKGFAHERSAETLRTKWDNIKKEARKLSKNVIDINNSSYNDLTRQIVAMMYDAENNAPPEPGENMDDDEFNEPVLSDEKLSRTSTKKRIKPWENESNESDDGNDNGKRRKAPTMAPEECSILLDCVRKEKNYVFSKDYKAHAIGLKNRAWKKITESFNKRSPRKRSQKVLRNKFVTLKKFAKNMGVKDVVKNFSENNIKHEMIQLVEESTKNMKSADDDHHISDNNRLASDSLSAMLTVLNSDSGIGSTHSSPWSEDNKDAVKSKLELLNYKMDTARLERRRIEEASAREAAAREANALASALRLRTARLEAIAAAERLPRGHPALLFTTEERPAEIYLRNELGHT